MWAAELKCKPNVDDTWFTATAEGIVYLDVEEGTFEVKVYVVGNTVEEVGVWDALVLCKVDDDVENVADWALFSFTRNVEVCLFDFEDVQG